MDVFEAIDRRESIRSFLDKQITDKELEAILHAAERSPRIGGLDILVLQDAERYASYRIQPSAK
jgi:nitroreductase